MSAQHMDNYELNIANTNEPKDSPNSNNNKSKLERRRRIEDLNEERRLQKELYEF